MKTAEEWFDIMITGSPDIKEVISKIQKEAYNQGLQDAAKKTDYACFAKEEQGNEINWADAGAFFLEGYKEAFRWREIEKELPEVKKNAYFVIVKYAEENRESLRDIGIEKISCKEDVQYIETCYTHWRPINQEDVK